MTKIEDGFASQGLACMCGRAPFLGNSPVGLIPHETLEKKKKKQLN